MASKLIRDIWSHKLLIVSIAVSVLLLRYFLNSQESEAKMLGLDAKWLLVSGVPLLVALLLGGYIKTFKGLGIELESNLNAPLPRSVISPFKAIKCYPMEKESISLLNDMSSEERKRIVRLKLVLQKIDFYNWQGLNEHFLKLENLQYLEIVNKKGEFLYLLPAAYLSPTQPTDVGTIDVGRTQQFIAELESGSLIEFEPQAVSESVINTDSTIDVYRKLKQSNQAKILDRSKKMLPVLNEEKVMIGLVDAESVAIIIADDVEKIVK